MRRVLAALALALGLWAGTPGELGLPFITNIRPREYAGPPQNWDFVEDARGIVFVGNTAGVLEFDGNAWRMIPTRNRTAVRSLGLDAGGRVFVGAKNEFGYLAPDASGLMRYVPLEDLVEPAARAFADVWNVLPTPEGVYFQTREYLFFYDGKAVRTFKADTSFTLAWKVRGRIHLYERGIGPVVLDRGRFVPLAGAGKFTKELVNFMLPWGAGQSILLGTSHQGLFLYDGWDILPFPTDADAELARITISHGVLLRDGNLAVGAIRGGCWIFDRQGRLRMRLDRQGGLQEDFVNRLFVDRRSRLWLGLNRGMARVEWPSPFTAFGEDSGLEGTVNALARHGGLLYAGTSKGLFVLGRSRPKAGASPVGGPLWRFRRVEDIHGQVWGFSTVQDRLMVCNASGLYEARGDRAALALSTEADRDALCLARSRRDPSRFYLGLATGVARLRWNGVRWKDEGRIPGLKAEARTLAEAGDGSLWVGTQSSGVRRVIPRPGGPPEVETYGPAQGLPSLAHDFVRELSTGLVFTTHAGFYRFDEATRRFQPDPRFAALFPQGPRYPDGVVEGPGGRIWMHVQDEATLERDTGYAEALPGHPFRFEKGPWKRLADSTIYAILPEADGTVWMGGPDGLVRYDPGEEFSLPWSSGPLVRRITGPGRQTLHGGAGAWNGAGRLPFASNTLRFEFAAPGGSPESATQYRVRLEGYDRAWSPWSSETFRDYTNLPEGAYRFQVAARNGNGQVTPASAVGFRILPPFYRTWWAYLVYVALGALTLQALVQWRLWRSRLARKVLVRKVVERTEQLRRKTTQLELAKAEAEAATRAKSEFLANMSHEIRTPLNAILGYAEILRDEVEEPRLREHLAAISSGGKALLGIIGDILDLSKIEAGRMELEYAPAHVGDLVRDVVRTFALRCREKGLDLQVEEDPALPGILVVSQVHLRQILFNLMGNAVKFTERGAVSVALKEWGRGPDSVDLAIEVRDTGIGIPEGQRETIFDAFHQVSGQDASRYGGTGLGLAICRRLADMMGGELRVASAQGQGSTFTLFLHGVAVSSEEAVHEDLEAPFRGEFLPATLLLVDDVKPNRELLKHFFESFPFRFEEAQDGAEAVAVARRVLPDLIVMDLRMPVLDGIQATRILKADDRLKAIPVIILTASTTQSDEAPVWESGADGFLRKPVSRSRLAAEIARFLPCRGEAAPGGAREPSPEVRAALPRLLAELEGEAQAEWRQLEDSFFIDRMTGFAARMAALADTYGEPGLKAWSGQVLDQAGAFDMENLPATFRRFPDVVDAIRRLCG
ncbi:hybrid sensor histidine kinase/response regulator [Mesoterricola silvestris]|uniref:histidine kinase n=1 Tax=Mesoterricola silvestris TaxID=2927979 RepID=A0AA48GLN5_9BACT|nr:hybrid sensor histidine kinase/response regulator [Mesoterricola silvestris]BDU71755.1 histidine kinase [Mesoterricola silvestris]